MASPDLARTGDEDEIRFAPLLLAVIMAVGLVLRLVFLSAALPTGGYPLVLDEGNYVGLAQPLVQGQGFVDKWVWIRPPAYPIFLALSLVASGGLVFGQWLQVLLSVANIGLLYPLAIDAFTLRAGVSRRRAQAVGLAGAALLAFNPHAVLYANQLMPETLYMLALTIMAWGLLRALHIWRQRNVESQLAPQSAIRNPQSALVWIAVAGLAAGIGTLLRSVVLTFVPILLVWFWWVMPRRAKDELGEGTPGPKRLAWFTRRWSWRSLVPLVLFVVLTFAPIVPWSVYSYTRWHRFLLVDTTGGWNLLQYNINISTTDLENQLMQIPNPIDRGNYATRWGIQAILDQPGQFITEGLQRFGDAWPVENFGELRLAIRNKYPGIDCTYQDIFAWVETAFYAGFGLLTIWGVAISPGRTFKTLFLLYALHYGLITLLAHPEFRYHLPLYPYASVFAGWALVDCGLRIASFRFWRHRLSQTRNSHSASRNWLVLGIAAVLSLLFLVQCSLQAVPGMIKSIRYEKRYLQGKSEFDSGNYAAALASFISVTDLDKGCSCLYRYIGMAQGKLGQRNDEITSYFTGLQREAFDWRTAAILSDRLRAQGSPKAASPILGTRPEFRAVQLQWGWDNLSPPPVSSLDLSGDDIGYVTAFQAPETESSPGGTITYRWTTGHSYARLAVPQGSGAVQLVVRFHSLGWPQADDQVSVAVNGREVGVLTAHPAWGEARLTLPDSAVSSVDSKGQLVVELLTPTYEPPGPETRQLGVAVDYMRLERVK